MADPQMQTVDVPGVGEVDFPASMPDAAIIAAVKKLSMEGDKASIAKVQANAPKLAAANQKPLPPEHSFSERLAAEFSPQNMAGRAARGLQGEAEGLAGGLTALPLAIAGAIRHPVDTADKIGDAATWAGGAAYSAYQNPSRAWNKAQDAALSLGSDPRSIGRVAGGVDAALLGRAAWNSPGGQAVKAGLKQAANKYSGGALEKGMEVYKAAKLRSPAAGAAASATERVPGRLVKLPDEVLNEDQLLRALRPGARLEGMKSAARTLPGDSMPPMTLDEAIELLRKSAK